MEEARQVVDRLKRIEELERRGAPSRELLAELRKLVLDGEAWLRAEHEPAAAVEALERCRIALEGDGEDDRGQEEVALLAR
jgi:hypothetical protein